MQSFLKNWYIYVQINQNKCTISLYLRNQYGKQNVEIIDLYVKIEKKRRTIRDVIYLDIFGYILINLPQSLLRTNPGQVTNDQTFGISLVSVKSIEKVTSKQEQVQKYCNWRKESHLRLQIKQFGLYSNFNDQYVMYENIIFKGTKVFKTQISLEIQSVKTTHTCINHNNLPHYPGSARTS